MSKREKSIFIVRGYKEKIDTENVENILEQTGLVTWIPALRRLHSGVTKSIEQIRQANPLNIPQIDISDVRSLLNNEKAKLLHVIKTKKPNSIYALAKLSGRDFKSVRQDLELFEKFGLIKFAHEKTKLREKLKPILQVDKLNVFISL